MPRTSRLLVAMVTALVLVSGTLGPATTPASAASRAPRFLSLPFRPTSRMTIQQAFYWIGPGHERYHGGIDYILGKRDRSATWRSFPVYAAAPGYACSQLSGRKGCIEGVGNRVLITHTIKGKLYRSYYGHLRAISRSIPRGGGKSVFVKRGELLGYSGYSGDPCCVIHLHFQLFDSRWRTVDPYGIYGTRNAYPDPLGTNGRHNGSPSYWLTDPPTPPAKLADRPVKDYPDPKPTRKPTRTPRPEPTRTPRPKPTRTARPAPEPTPTPTLRPGPTPTPTLPPDLDTVGVLRVLAGWVVAVLQALRGGL